MSTDAQIAANQRNALASTGPRTAEGKARSRRNALKHGLTAERISLIGRDLADYESLRAELFALHEPACEVEVMLVDRLATLLWRLRRAALLESGLIAEAERLAQAARVAQQPERTGEMVDLALQKHAGTADALLKTSQYEGRIERAYDRTFDLLNRVQNRRRSVVRHVREGGGRDEWEHDILVDAPEAAE